MKNFKPLIVTDLYTCAISPGVTVDYKRYTDTNGDIPLTFFGYLLEESGSGQALEGCSGYKSFPEAIAAATAAFKRKVA